MDPIYNRERIKQVVNFSGLRWGSKMPTDIDCFYDEEAKVFIIVEFKHAGAKVPFGQRLALERLAAATTRGGIPTWVLVATHNTPTHMDIDAASCIVTAYYDGLTWRTSSKGFVVREAMDILRNKYKE